MTRRENKYQMILFNNRDREGQGFISINGNRIDYNEKRGIT